MNEHILRITIITTLQLNLQPGKFPLHYINLTMCVVHVYIKISVQPPPRSSTFANFVATFRLPIIYPGLNAKIS